MAILKEKKRGNQQIKGKRVGERASDEENPTTGFGDRKEFVQLDGTKGKTKDWRDKQRQVHSQDFFGRGTERSVDCQGNPPQIDVHTELAQCSSGAVRHVRSPLRRREEDEQKRHDFTSLPPCRSLFQPARVRN